MNILRAVDLDSEIKRLLTWFVVYVNIDNKLNLTDINVYAENFIIPLLNSVLDCNLENLNTYDDENYPGIDLGDRSKRIAVQVTSSTVRQKIDKTIEKFESREEYMNFDTLYVAALSHEKPNYRDFKTNGKYAFKQKNILSINELMSMMKDRSDSVKQEIMDSLKKKMNIPQDEESKLTIEDFLVNKFFEQIVKLAKEEVLCDSADFEESALNHGDLDVKRTRFDRYWSYVETCYRDVIQLRQERLFHKAFERLDSSERIQLQKFLGRESEKALLKTDNPVEALDIVKKDIVSRASISLLSETQVENYLYYQLYICKLLPNPVGIIHD